MVRAGQQQWQSARDAFEHALRIEPMDIDTHRALAEVLEKLGQADEAQQHAVAATELAKARAAVLAELGESYLQNGHLEQATAAFRRAVHLDANNSAAQSGLSRAIDAANGHFTPRP
jgi:Tfp pilus assembly protein PilF